MRIRLLTQQIRFLADVHSETHGNIDQVPCQTTVPKGISLGAVSGSSHPDAMTTQGHGKFQLRGHTSTVGLVGQFLETLP